MKRGILCGLSALLLMAMLFRPGIRVEVNGTVLPEIYAPETARESAALADRAAEEICRAEEAPPYRLYPVFCARYTGTDGDSLARTLLTAYDGVTYLYAVYDGDKRVGTTDDPGLPETVYDEAAAAWSVTGRRAPRPLRVERVLTYPAAVTDVMALMNAVGELW